MKKAAATIAAATEEAAAVEKRLGLNTYSRPDGAVTVEISPHNYVSAECLALASGRTRATSER